jgi:hypothetical protein
MTKKELELVKRELNDLGFTGTYGKFWGGKAVRGYFGDDWKLIEPKIDWNIIKQLTDKVRNWDFDEWGKIKREDEKDYIVEFDKRFNNVMDYLHKLKEEVNND